MTRHEPRIGAVALLVVGAACAGAGSRTDGASRVEFEATAMVGRDRHIDQVEGVTFSRDGRWMATADNGGTLVLWVFSETGPTPVATLSGRNFTEVAFATGDRVLAAAGFDSVVRIFRVPSGEVADTFRYAGPVEALAISPDGRLLAAAGGGERSIHIRDLDSRAQLRVLAGHSDDVYTLRFSPDGSRLASGGRDRTIRFWSVATGDTLGVVADDGDSVYGLAFSDDGRMLASACRDGSVAIREPGSGRRLRTLRGHDASVHGVAFSSDGRFLATAGFDGIVGIWDPSTGAQLTVLRGHRAKVSDVAFAPGTNLVASVASDTTVRLWSMR